MLKTDEHVIDEYQLEFCDTDGGETFIDGVGYPVRKNNIICAKPGQKRWTSLPFCCYYIKIPKDNLALSPILSSMKDCWSTSDDDMERFLQVFHSLSEGRELGGMRYYSTLVSLITSVAEDSDRYESGKKHLYEKAELGEAERAVLTAKKYIDEHFGEKCSLDDISKHAGFSPIYFHKLFKKEIGMTPNEYLLKRRLEGARECLTSGEMPLCEIAERCGFGSQSYFQYVFRREAGMTPSAYRKREHVKYFE